VTPAEAVAFVQKHGVVLESANGQVPSLAQAITGDKIKGSWWAHPRGKEIFQITRIVRESDQVLVCRLISGKVTLVHRRLWPALSSIRRQVNMSQRRCHFRAGCQAIFLPRQALLMRRRHWMR
jgi:hypothetical protein